MQYKFQAAASVPLKCNQKRKKKKQEEEEKISLFLHKIVLRRPLIKYLVKIMRRIIRMRIKITFTE